MPCPFYVFRPERQALPRFRELLGEQGVWLVRFPQGEGCPHILYGARSLALCPALCPTRSLAVPRPVVGWLVGLWSLGRGQGQKKKGGGLVTGLNRIHQTRTPNAERACEGQVEQKIGSTDTWLSASSPAVLSTGTSQCTVASPPACTAPAWGGLKGGTCECWVAQSVGRDARARAHSIG